MIYLYDLYMNQVEARSETAFVSLYLCDTGNLMTITGEATDNLPGIEYIGFWHPDEPDNFLIFRRQTTSHKSTQIFDGVHILYDDLKGRYITDLRPQNVSVAPYLTQYIESAGWKIGAYKTQAKTSQTAYYVSSLEAVSALIEETGIIIRPRIELINGKIGGKYIDVYDPENFGSNTGRRFRHGFAGVEIITEQDQAGLYTALIGRGAGLPIENEAGELTGGYTRRIMFGEVSWSKSLGDPLNKPKGQIYLEDKQATEKYGYPQPDGSMRPKIGIITLDKIDDPVKLLEMTYKNLCDICRPLVTMKVSRANAKGVKLGDKVVAIRGPYSFETSIIEAKHNLKNVALTEYVFGDIIAGGTSSEIKKLKQTIQENRSISDNWAQLLKNEIDSYYWGEDSYNYDIKPGNPYGLPAGYYGFDRAIDDNPTKVIYQGAGKILLSNSKKADGTWDWKLAADGNGFYAERMFADHITGNLIRGSIIESIATSRRPGRYGEPVSFWDLDNGHLVSESANIYGDLYVDSKKYPYRHYNVAEWLDKIEEISKTADQASKEAKTAASNAQRAANSASSAASSAQQTANTANSIASTARSSAINAQNAARSAQEAANAANATLSRFLTPGSNEFGYPTSGIAGIWLAIANGIYHLEVNPVGYPKTVTYSIPLQRIS